MWQSLARCRGAVGGGSPPGAAFRQVPGWEHPQGSPGAVPVLSVVPVVSGSRSAGSGLLSVVSVVPAVSGWLSAGPRGAIGGVGGEELPVERRESGREPPGVEAAEGLELLQVLRAQSAELARGGQLGGHGGTRL